MVSMSLSVMSLSQPSGAGARDEIPTAGRNKYTAEISNRGSSNATKQEYIMYSRER